MNNELFSREDPFLRSQFMFLPELSCNITTYLFINGNEIHTFLCKWRLTHHLKITDPSIVHLTVYCLFEKNIIIV